MDKVTLTLSVAASFILSCNLSAEEYYQREEMPTPEGEIIEIGSLALMPNNRLAVGTRRGEIWIVSDIYNKDVSSITWQKVFDAAHEPLGMFYKDNWLHFTDRDAYAKITDTDNNGSYETYEVISNQWGIKGDYHEYNFGTKPDKNGDVWVVHCLTGSYNAHSQWRGWAQRISPDGTTTPVVSGIRSPGGIGFNDLGDAFYTDNQGLWNGTSCIKHLKEGSFTGNPSGNIFYKDAPHMGPRPKEPKTGSRIVTEAKRIPEFVPPAIQLPHGKVGQSPTAIVNDHTKGKFGPFSNQLLIGEQTHSEVQRVYLEKVNGVYQGAAWKMIDGFRAGLVAMELSETGVLFTGGTNRGWASKGGKSFTLERVKWTGKEPLAMHKAEATSKGFRITFTEAVDPKSISKDQCLVKAWTYIYQKSYGSPEVDPFTPTVTAFNLDASGKVLEIELDKLTQGHIHHIKLKGVKSLEGGKSLWKEDVYYTLNEIPK